MNIRTCCALHANNDAADELMEMDYMNRTFFLEENGHVDYHYHCPAGRTYETETTFVVDQKDGNPALFERNESGEPGTFIEAISYCPECGQKLTTEDNSGIPNHWGEN